MKEIVVISGKGGTGKTSITAAFASMAKNAVFADCDVDAADLHLVLQPEVIERQEFFSGNEAQIDPDICISCGKCFNTCRFNAIEKIEDEYRINPYSCEGCGVCVHVCPVNAVNFPERKCGEWYVSKTRFGKMAHARLGIAAENSGRLVTLVRTKAKELATQDGKDLVVIDGPPGIGCPVIASITGADAVVVITEPTLSGVHDLRRVLKLAKFFEVNAYVCINKWDINPNITEAIEAESSEAGVTTLGRISYHPDVTKAQLMGISVNELEESPVSVEISAAWDTLMRCEGLS